MAFESSSEGDDNEWIRNLEKGPATGAGGTGAPSPMMDARRRALQAQREKVREQHQQRLEAASKKKAAITEKSAKGDRRTASEKSPPSSKRVQTKGKESDLPTGIFAHSSSSSESSEADDTEKGEEDEDNSTGSSGTGSIRGEGDSRSESTSSSSSAPPASRKRTISGRDGKKKSEKQVESKSARAQKEKMSPSELMKKRVEELRIELDAKKRVLQAAKEKEMALLDRLRAEKAKKTAELSRLDRELAKGVGALQEAERALEDELRALKEEHDKRLSEERERVEAEVRSEYEPKLASLRQTLEDLREKEKTLRQGLVAGEANRDIVTAAVGGALAQIVKRLEQVYEETVEKDATWNEAVREAVRKEIETSFAVTVDVEAQAEREAYARGFDEFLEFWKKAEAEQRTHIRTLDELLLLDVQSLLQEDVDKLQTEELAMEDTYSQLQDAWAEQHRSILNKELDDAMRRRREELEEQRTTRIQLHTERMHDIDNRHREMLDACKHLHEREVELLKEQFSQEELLQKERRLLLSTVHDDVSKATRSLLGVAESLDGLLASTEAYKDVVEQGQKALDDRRLSAMREWKDIAADVKKLVIAQLSNVEKERRLLGVVSTKMDVIQQSVCNQLEQEKIWLAEQQSQYEQAKITWEREYRLWKQTVAQERQRAEERFTNTLAALHESATLLAEEKANIDTETRTMERAFNRFSEKVARETHDLERHEAGLQTRYHEMHQALDALRRKSGDLARQWKKLQKERVALSGKRGGLKEEELHIQTLSAHLAQLKASADGAKADAAVSANRNRLLHHNIETVKNTLTAVGRREPHRQLGYRPMHEYRDPQLSEGAYNTGQRASHRVRSRNSLPQQVLQELRAALIDNVAVKIPPREYHVNGRLLPVAGCWREIQDTKGFTKQCANLQPFTQNKCEARLREKGQGSPERAYPPRQRESPSTASPTRKTQLRATNYNSPTGAMNTNKKQHDDSSNDRAQQAYEYDENNLWRQRGDASSITTGEDSSSQLERISTATHTFTDLLPISDLDSTTPSTLNMY